MPRRPADLSTKTIVVHGHSRAYVKAGKGPALLLLHGIGSDLRTWDTVLPQLAERFTVIAPDLLGHGRSAKPRADYSLGGYANGMRDLLTVLGVDRATVVGHSFGGGIAMQLAYQFPEKVQRVALVGSGGLGPEVSPLLRLLTVPGAGLGLAAVEARPVRAVARAALAVLQRLPIPALHDLHEVATVYDGLADPAARSAFLHVLRAAVDHRGQVVTMVDRAYLAQVMPTLVIWGGRDTVIPVSHVEIAKAVLPGTRAEVFPRAGHFPHRDEPERFVDLLSEWVASTAPAHHDRQATKALLRGEA